MEIVVVGRHTEVAERFRRHVEDKLAKVSQLAPGVQRIDVEVTHEKNPRLADVAEKVELTVRAKGPVVRAEAAADDRYGALDLALDKLNERLRRAHDRRTRTKRRGDALNAAVPVAVEDTAPQQPAVEQDDDSDLIPHALGEAVEFHISGSPVVIRNKLHQGAPMNAEEAIDEMELVGHDFFLFIDKVTSRPSVAYRRRGWDYGVIALDTTCN
ncbi:ribosome-associated translation inhibitor RaiA [Rarobacter faecitabidus]|uniref:Ribosome hibernation promoting factor n=1 Tax=Rarobacter faecitabidus TaxID=13243 RepID=A0A542ZU97_RARFA|nr:ribosome-associated translation inhibitor RaiA [Rarobacter faecitabidus]TQL63928.1 ribosomal subunit interface protein [Rarobacter faecitabidus]